MVRLIQLDQCHHLGDIWQSAHNTSAGTASTFVYDGVSRLDRVVDTAHGAITADRAYL